MRERNDERAYEAPRRAHVLRAEEEFTVEGGLLTLKLSKKRGPIGERYAEIRRRRSKNKLFTHFLLAHQGFV